MNKNARQELRPTLGEYLLVDAPHKAQDPVLLTAEESRVWLANTTNGLC